MEVVMGLGKNSEEPSWLEENVSGLGNLRVWHVIFLCLTGVTTLTVIVCCCFRFRIPRTKQQIEADYQRRMITSKFRQQLETIQDSKVDSMSLKEALELLYEKTKNEMDEEQKNSQQSSPQPSSLDTSTLPDGQKANAPSAGQSFVKFATKVSQLSKVTQQLPANASAETKIDF